MSRLFLGKSLDASHPLSRQEGARYALFVLTSLNLLNYADRYVPAAVKTLLQQDLELTDAETALPAFGMTLVYSVLAVIFGWLNDYQLMDRRLILFIAIIVWSIATTFAGLARNLTSLVLLRSLVGVGEAAYSSITPPMLSDFYMLHERQVVYAIYYLALPIGGAFGFMIGALVGSSYGWRVAFYVCGIPGLLLSFAVLRINDPVRGINDPELSEVELYPEIISPIAEKSFGDEDMERSDQHISTSSLKKHPSSPPTAQPISQPTAHRAFDWNAYGQEFKQILTNPVFMCCAMGLAANAYCLGGLTEWYATYLLRYNQASLSSAGLIAGAATIIGGILGNILGSKVADYFDGKVRSSYLLIPALFCIPAAICNIWAVNTVNNASSAYAAIFFTQIFAWTQIGPISAVYISCIPPPLRARAGGIIIILQHFLGDVISPPIIGAVSDATGSLQTGLQSTWIAMIISGLWWGIAAIMLPPISFGQMKQLGMDKTPPVTYFDILTR